MISWPLRRARRTRTPTVLQLEAAECGAASLAMVLAFHGRHVPLEALRLACGVSRDGAKASSILAAARRYGLEAKGFKAEPEHLRELAGPMIAFINFNHFVVIEAVGAERVWLNDPAQGRRTMLSDEFDEAFTGVVLTFRPGPGFEPGDTRPSIARSLLARSRGFRSGVAFVLLANLLLVIPGLITPAFARVFVDDILIRRFDDWLWPLLLGLGLTALVRFCLAELQSWHLTRTELRLAVKGSGELFARILSLPISFFGVRYAGEIAQRLHLNDDLARLATGDVARAGLSTLTAVFFLTAMLLLYWPLALLVFALNGLNVLVLVGASSRLAEGHQKLAIDEGKLAGVAISGLQDIETFKAAGAEDSFFSRWTGLHTAVLNERQRLGRTAAFAGSVPPFLAAASTAAILSLGGVAVMHGEMTLGTLIALQTLAASFSAPFAALAGFGLALQELASHTRRIDDVLGQAPAVDLSDEKETGDTPLPAGKLEVVGVTFGHLPLDAPLIENFSLTAQVGAQVALVGGSGSGKSTLGRLIAGLLPPASGEVRLDGRRLADWHRAVLTRAVAYVDQEIVLFEGTIRENLSLWNPTIPDARLLAAAEDAEVLELILSRPGGLDAPVEEGGRNFSGGERQRLEIARALALEPRVLVLDEATSALDPITEENIMKKLRRRGCTQLVIAHRLSTIRDSDEIIVLERGQVQERGTHERLLARPGAYRRLLEA